MLGAVLFAGTAAAADNSTENYTVLRDAPVDQSFEYLQGADSVNVSIENETVVVAENETSGVYVTNEIRSENFSNMTVTVDANVSVEVVDTQAENETVVKSVELSSGNNTVDLSGVNTTGITVKVSLDDGESLTGLTVRGVLYDDGVFGGVTGGITKAVGGIGEILAGVGTFVTGILEGVVGIPVGIVDLIGEVIA